MCSSCFMPMCVRSSNVVVSSSAPVHHQRLRQILFRSRKSWRWLAVIVLVGMELRFVARQNKHFVSSFLQLWKPILWASFDDAQQSNSTITSSTQSLDLSNGKNCSHDKERFAIFIPPNAAYKQQELTSFVHCVGENWEKSAPLYRSCQFRNLCWNPKLQDFALFPSETLQELDRHVNQVWQATASTYARISTLMKGRNSQLINRSHPLQVMPVAQRFGYKQHFWFPRIVDDMNEKAGLFVNGYWQIDDNVMLIPIYLPTREASSAQPTDNHETPMPSIWSLLTETIFPIFTLMSMFRNESNKNLDDMKVLVHFLPQPGILECGTITTDSISCWPPHYTVWWRNALRTFVSWDTLVTAPSVHTSTGTKSSRMRKRSLYLAPSLIFDSSDSLICSRHGVAGMASLTDHRLQLGHGERGDEYRITPQVGRGPQWWEFRNYILQHHQHQSNEQGHGTKRDHQKSSIINERLSDFGGTPSNIFQAITAYPPALPFGKELENALEQQLNEHNSNQTETTTPTQLRKTMRLINLNREFPACCGTYDVHAPFGTIADCIRLATQSNFYITTTEDMEHAVENAESFFWPALFLPRGATLVLYYNESKMVRVGRKNYRPRMLHFNVWNNVAFLQVHWLPMPGSVSHDTPSTSDLDIVTRLLQIELQRFVERNHDNEPHKKETPPGHWTLNGFNLVLRKSASPDATIHCVGDNFLPSTHFINPSCYVQNMCLRLVENKSDTSAFFARPSQRQQELAKQLLQWNQSFASISTDAQVYHKRVTVGRIISFSAETAWFPDFVGEESHPVTKQYYELPRDVVWIPILPHYRLMPNPGHIVWDLLLPIYNLLSMFGLEKQTLFMTILAVDPLVSSDIVHAAIEQMQKFIPMLGVSPVSFRILQEMKLGKHIKHGTRRIVENSNDSIVCSSHAALGMAMLNDNGSRYHGNYRNDYSYLHNAGRGNLFYNFRKHILRRLTLVDHTTRKLPYKALFSINSSRHTLRRKSFTDQIAHLKTSFSAEVLSVQGEEMSNLSVTRQLELMMDTSIFVSVMGGATFSGMFLPRGSCVILYFNDVEGNFLAKVKEINRPAMLDFDFWNNASYLRVHWLPTKTMNDAADLETLRLLIQHEIYILSNQ